MNTAKRLDKVFRDAFPVPFDDESKIVFFGDVHRGDDSLSDEFGRNRHIYDHALDFYYENGCTYVEVGDGDELLEQPRFKHIYTAHVTTFDILKKYYKDGRLLMIYGNHNYQLRKKSYLKKHFYYAEDDYSETKDDLFPGITAHEAIIFKHRETGQEIFAVHGHQGDFINDQLWFLSFLLIRFLWRFLHILGVKYAASPSKSRHRRHKVEKNYNKWNTDHNIMIICGHTHRAKFPREGEPAYFNTGCCIHPRGLTCLELICGQISLVSWRTHTRKDGSMYVKRTVLQGPEPITTYLTPPADRPKRRRFFRRQEPTCTIETYD